MQLFNYFKRFDPMPTITAITGGFLLREALIPDEDPYKRAIVAIAAGFTIMNHLVIMSLYSRKLMFGPTNTQ